MKTVKGTEVKREFKVLRDVISPENVQVMAELMPFINILLFISSLGTIAVDYLDYWYSNRATYSVKIESLAMSEKTLL